jgi:hypothetical protein
MRYINPNTVFMHFLAKRIILVISVQTVPIVTIPQICRRAEILLNVQNLATKVYKSLSTYRPSRCLRSAS